MLLLEQWSWLIYGGNNELEPTLVCFSVSIAILAILLWFLWAFEKLKNGRARLPPGPRGLPLVGYLPFLGTNLHHLFMKLAQVHGPIFKFWLGSKLCVVLSSASLIREVVRDQDVIFANRYLSIAGWVFSNGGNDIALAPYDSNWRTLRKIFVRDMLSNANLDACYTLRRDEIRKIIRDVFGKIGTPIDIRELTFLAVFNATTSMLWGATLEGEKWTSLGNEFREAVSKLSKLLAKPNVSDFFPALARFDIQGVERETKKVSNWIEQIFDSVLSQRMKLSIVERGDTRENEKKDFLQFVLELKELKCYGTLTLKQIKALLVDVVVGGTDTTSTTAEWVMAEMMKHPEVMKRAYEELIHVVGENNIVEEFHLPKLKYLDAVVKETLRLHPPIPLLIPRSPSRSSTVGGYAVPKDTMVFVNIWAMQQDPQIWESPLTFQPERFLSNANKLDYSGNNLKYLPFGSGRRICAGIHLAERILMCVLASFLHSFDWKLPDGTELDLSEKFGSSLKKSTPLMAIPTPRLSNLELYT